MVNNTCGRCGKRFKEGAEVVKVLTYWVGDEVDYDKRFYPGMKIRYNGVHDDSSYPKYVHVTCPDESEDEGPTIGIVKKTMEPYENAMDELNQLVSKRYK